MKNLYFISESIPHNGYGSFVIFYRHLLRLEKSGYKIHLIIPDYQHINSDDYLLPVKDRWYILKVPPRKWWFFPYRFKNSTLRKIRYKNISTIFKNHFKNHPADFIISYLHSEYLNGFAAHLKLDFKCGMGVFLHDDKSYKTNKDYLPYDQFICSKSDIIWTVTDYLKVPNTDSSKYITLFPIPEGNNDPLNIINWQNKYKKPKIGFSGTLYKSYENLFDKMAKSLSKISGELILVTKDLNEKWIKDLALKNLNIKLLPSFPENTQAVQYLKENCSAIFCGYPESLKETPWIVNSFPSKLIEYSHIGLPIILTSPESTYLKKWIINNDWKLYAEEYSIDAFDSIFKDILDPKTWMENAMQAREFANNFFNPNYIHNKFESTILPFLKIYDPNRCKTL